MEDSKGNGRRRNRSRSSSFVSSLSSRLNPDFDPRLYYKNDVDLRDNKLSLHDSDQELDPMTVDFDTLVGFLHPTFIVDYLKKILQFFNSKSNELCFPNIAQYKESFLVKIANDNQRLMCAAFNEPCRVLGAQILRVIEENKNFYRWIHMYESGRVTRNVLVYKKMFYNERKSTISNNEFKKPGLAHASPKTHKLTQSFMPKTTFINSTMKFLSHDDQLNLEYPQMTKAQAECYNCVLCNFDCNTDIGFGFESLYAPLYKLLKEAAYKFEFQVIRNVIGEDAVCMSFKKIRKNYPQQTHPPSRITPSVDNFKEPAAPRHMLNHKYLSKQRVVEALSDGFIKTSLDRILEFIDDDKRASLEFGKLTADESSFLQLILNISRHVTEYATLFTEEVLMTFKKIFLVLKYETQQRKRWRLNVNVGRLDRNKLGNVVFVKIPMMDNKQNRSVPDIAQRLMELSTKDLSQMTSSNATSTRGDSSYMSLSLDSNVPDIAHRLMELSTKDVSQITSSNATSTPTSTRGDSPSTSLSLDSNVPDIAKRLMELSTRDMSSSSLDHCAERQGLGFSTGNDVRVGRSKSCSKDTSKTDRSQSRGRKRLGSKERRKTSKYGISFQSAGDQIIDTMSHSTTASDSCQTGVRVTRQFGFGRKQRLMDDLSTPVEIDRAKRMMEQMGWDGGPLGARGEGITEPIMPAIHIAPGAGLGHIKPHAQSHSTSEFRVKFLTSVLEFITGTEMKTSICFHKALTKREMRFLAPTVKSINKRKPLGLKLEEMKILNSILDEMFHQPTLLIQCEVGNGNREIRIYKKKGDQSKIKTGNLKKGLVKTFSNIPILQHIQDDNAEIITTEEVLNTNIGIHCSNQKGYKRIAEKVTFLKRINDFLRTTEEKKDYVCDFILNTKQREYIHQAITVINRRDMNHKFGTIVENKIYCNIKRNINNCYMTVIFSGQKFTLHKRYYQKRFTNSSVDATPEKNTIIYKNNTAKRISDVKIDGEHKNSEKHDKNTIVDYKNDEKDLALSDQDDILLIDYVDLEDLETDSESNKSESKDDYKDLESDCEEILDLSDDCVLRELFERDNEAYIVLDDDSGDSTDIEVSIDETNADTSKRDNTTVVVEKNSVIKDQITRDVIEVDVKNNSGSKIDSHEINIQSIKIEAITPKHTQSDLIMVDGNNKLDKNVINRELHKLQRDGSSGSENKGSNFQYSVLADSVGQKHSVFQENVDILDTSIDEISLTPPIIENKDETHNIKEHTDTEYVHDSMDEFHPKYRETQQTSEEFLTPTNSKENSETIHNESLGLERIDLKVHAELEICVNSDEYNMIENISINDREKLEENVDIDKEFTLASTHHERSQTERFNDSETKISKEVIENKTSQVNNNFGKDENSDLPVKEDQIKCGQSDIIANDKSQNNNNKYGGKIVSKRSFSNDSVILESSPSSSKRSRSNSENSFALNMEIQMKRLE